jgi:hypothetical protein
MLAFLTGLICDGRLTEEEAGLPFLLTMQDRNVGLSCLLSDS